MRQFSSGIFERTTGIAALALATSLLMLAPVCRAQSDAAGDSVTTVPQSSSPAGDAGNNSAMMPARARIRVVRLSDVEGKVQILRGDQTQFPQALMNMPLTQGAQIDTGVDERAEIEFEDGSVARITPNSSLKISDLTSTTNGVLDTTVEQLSGLIYYELRSDPMTPFHVMFNGRTASPLMDSTFRINLENHPQDLAVLDGRVQVAGVSDSYSAEVHQGKTIQFANGKYTIADWTAPNGFDDWNQQRDQEAAQEAQNQTPARVQQGGGSVMDSGVGYGWSDLDNAGGWYPLPGYGTVWQPYGVGADFDPYGYGAWGNFGGGYSFISGYPWGWLPFNCGAWSYIGSFGWGWSPGLYGCGGFGFGIGYGYGRYGYWNRRGNSLYPHTNIHSAPPGYRAPTPPSIAKGQTPQQLVPVGNRSGMGAMTANLRTAHGNRTADNYSARSVRFNGEKIAPLHSMMTGVRVPTRNAALYNNYPSHAFQGDIRGSLMSHSAEGTGNRVGLNDRMGMHGSMNGSMERTAEMNRGRTVDMARGNSFAGNTFGGNDRAGFGAHSAFAQHTSFGPHGSFGGSHSAFAGASFHNGGGFRGGSMGRAGGFSGGGFHGGGGGGFHGGGGGGMGHGGGGGGGHSGR